MNLAVSPATGERERKDGGVGFGVGRRRKGKRGAGHPARHTGGGHRKVRRVSGFSLPDDPSPRQLALAEAVEGLWRVVGRSEDPAVYQLYELAWWQAEHAATARTREAGQAEDPVAIQHRHLAELQQLLGRAAHLVSQASHEPHPQVYGAERQLAALAELRRSLIELARQALSACEKLDAGPLSAYNAPWYEP